MIRAVRAPGRFVPVSAALVALAAVSADVSAQKFESPQSPAPKVETDGAVKARPAASQKGIPVRIGTHKGFTRIVFDWPKAVDYGVVQKDGTITIRFRRAAQMDVSGLAAGSSPAIVDAEVHSGAGQTAVKIRTREGIRVRHFRAGSGVVLDMLEPVKTAQSVLGGNAAAPGKPAPKARPRAREKSTAAQPEIARKPDQAAGEARQDSGVKAKSQGPLRLGAEAPARRPKPPGARTGPAGKARAERLTENAKARPTGPRTQAEAAPSQPRRLETATVPRAVEPASQVPVALSLEAREAVVRFNWEVNVAAAVFVRGGYLWVVFDRQLGMAFEGWEKRHPKRDRRARQSQGPIPIWAPRLGEPLGTQVPGNTVFRMLLPKGVAPRVGKEDTTWVVTLDQEIAPPVAGIPVEPQFSPVAGARLTLTVRDAGQAAAIRDPEAGDLVWVVPVKQPGRGIGLGRTFVEVALLATAQGIAGRAMRDGVVFKTLSQAVEITAPGGLNLSGTTAPGPLGPSSRRTAASRGASEKHSWLFDIGKMHQPSAEAFTRASHEFLEAAYKAPPSGQSQARLRLAQLFFAHGRFTDATGILQVIEADEPEFVDDPVFRALRGASYFFRGDRKRARRDLFHPNLDPYSEMSLWRGAVEAVDGNWAAASRLFSRAETIISAYPRHLRIRFGLLAAETALHVGDIALAKYHLETVRALKPERSIVPQLDFLRGHLLALTLDPEGAIEYWTKAARGVDPKYRVRATLARTQMLLKLQKIGLSDATKELEKLRYAWRGDALEFRVLERLGDAYLKSGDFKNGLLTLRDAARYYPKQPETDGVIDRMRAAFIKLYVGREADKLPPLVSLALYDEFRELTPPGEVGSELIATLARRLVAVDLLDRSARLLKHLVDERLTGTDRLKVANQLGLVYLLDRKPDLALSTLSGDLPPDLAPKIATTRRHLRARALGELARFKEALAILQGDRSRDAEMLRAGIDWRLKNWAAAANAYQALVGMTAAKGKAESETRQRYVLSLAISLALSGDIPRLNAVREKFAAEMSKSRYRDAFNLVSGHSGPVPSNYRIITQKVAEVDLFQTFMKTYREKLLPAPGKAEKPEAKESPAKG